MRRRDFFKASAAVPGVWLTQQQEFGRLTLQPAGTIGGIRKQEGRAPIEGASWYVAEKAGDGLGYTFPAGTLAGARYLTADFLVDGKHLLVLGIRLKEGKGGREFFFRFATLNQIGLRLRMPLGLADQNRWGIDREGGFLKPRVGGDRVNLGQVDRLELFVVRKSPASARWCMTDLVVSGEEVPHMTDPVLPRGPLLDELGQSTLHDWPEKSRGVGEVTARIRRQLAEAPHINTPASFSRWGGWKGRRLTQGTGFFRTHNEGKRWWLVDPEGYAFWSAGLDCVRVDTTAFYDLIEKALTWLPLNDSRFKDIFETRAAADGRRMMSINYLAANMIRAFGPEGWKEKWAAIALAQMKALRFNTVANWSDWTYAREAQFPYVRPMSFKANRAGWIYRDFPDVFHPGFDRDAAEYAATLADTRDDPAFIGYFLMNEPTWAFSKELPAAGMLFNTSECHTRQALASWLRKKYPDDRVLASAWKMRATIDQVAGGRWTAIPTDEAGSDLRQFSTLMVERYFKGISAACRKVDPNHLNLGMRWAGVPPKWAVEGMKCFDLFSMNCYRERLPRDVTDEIHRALAMPVMVGEWHFGALDAGLPASGIGHLKNQADRARAYRVYLEDAASNPNCVGAHWFTLYDQSALGRFDGENYNIGFLDVCNRPYSEMRQAAIASHERIYDVAAGLSQSFDDVPEYLPKLY